MRINTKRVVVSMPPALYDAVKKSADETGRTVPAYIRRLVWKHVEENGETVVLFPEKMQ